MICPYKKSGAYFDDIQVPSFFQLSKNGIVAADNPVFQRIQGMGF